jgi:hypothetical protein
MINSLIEEKQLFFSTGMQLAAPVKQLPARISSRQVSSQIKKTKIQTPG